MFEKGKSYTYEEIEEILNETRDSVIEELEHNVEEQNSNSVSIMMFKVHSMLVLELYQIRLLHKEKDE